jgi:hypothetical protein
MRILASLLLAASSALAAAPKPINDGSSNTLLLAEKIGSYNGQGGPSATAEFGEPPCAGEPAKNTVWYRYVAPVNGYFVVEIRDEQGLRADLRLPGNPPGTVPIQTIVDGTSNTIAFDEERLETELDRGETVYLRVDAAEPFDFSWRFVEVKNDFYQDATFCPDAAGTIKTRDTGATLGAYESGLGLTTPGTWFLWTAPASGTYSFDLVGSRVLYNSTYSGFSLRAFGALNGEPAVPLGAAGGSTIDNSTVLKLDVVAGQSYYFLCSGPELKSDNAIWFSWYPSDSAGVLTWADDIWRGAESTGAAPTLIIRLRGRNGPLGGVTPTASPGTGPNPAIIGQDCTQNPVTITWPDDVRSFSFAILINQDPLVEPEENFQLSLVAGSVENGVSKVLISSDDGDGACGFPIRTIRVKEGEVAYLPVSRLSPGNTEIVGSWRVTGGTGTAGADWATGSGNLVLPSDGTSNTIIFPTQQDGEFEGDEYVNIEIEASQGRIVDGTSNTLLIIEDDDYFVPRSGKYGGIIDADGNGALVKFVLGDAGSATGTIDYQGFKYRFKGSFDAEGQLVTSLPRAGKVPLGLRLQFADGWDECAASVRDPEGTWADGSVRRLPYDGRKSVAPQAGRYTVVCEGAGGVTVPAVMNGAVLSDGSVRFVGQTADGTGVSLGGSVGFGGMFDFATSLYGKGGNFYGTFDLGLGPQQPGTECTQWWLKPWRAKDEIYPALPLQQCLATVHRFVPPARGEPITGGFGASLGDGSVRFLGGGTVADGTSNTIFFGERYQVSFPGDNPFKCSVKVNPKTGIFTGKLTPAGGESTTFYGAFLQGPGLDYGIGFYLGDGKAGTVEIRPAP